MSNTKKDIIKVALFFVFFFLVMQVGDYIRKDQIKKPDICVYTCESSDFEDVPFDKCLAECEYYYSGFGPSY